MLPPPAEKLQNFFGLFLQFQIGVDSPVAFDIRIDIGGNRFRKFVCLLLGNVYFFHGTIPLVGWPSPKTQSIGTVYNEALSE